MSLKGDVAVTASTYNGTAWQPLPQLLSPNASLLILSSAIRFRASVPDCNQALATLEYRSTAPVSMNVQEIARITVIVNDMGNYGCYNDCSTAESVPLLAVTTILIVNYGSFAHKLLLLKPGVLLGIATGIGMILIVVASVCAWLYFVNRLLSGRGKVQKKDYLSCGKADEDLLENEGLQEYNARVTADEDFTQGEIHTNQNLDYVATLEINAKEGVQKDDGAADLEMDNCLQDVNDAGTALYLIPGDHMYGLAQDDVASGANEASDADVPVDHSVDAAWQCQIFSGDKGLPSEAIQAPDIPGYDQIFESSENNCLASDSLPADYEPDHEFFGTDTSNQFQSTDTYDHLLSGELETDGNTSSGECCSINAEEAPLERMDCDDLDDDILPCVPNQHILPTCSAGEQDNTCMTNPDDMAFSSQPYEQDDQVDEEGMEHLGFSGVLRDPMEKASQEKRGSSMCMPENFMPATSLRLSLADDCTNSQNLEDDKASEIPFSESYDNTLDYPSSAVQIEAADRTQNDYPYQLDAVSIDFLSSNPLGDSRSSSSQSHPYTVGSEDVDRTVSIEPIVSTQSSSEQDGTNAVSADKMNLPIDSCPDELFDEEMSQMPELRLVLEVPEDSSFDEAMDPLEHINLVLSSLETDSDGSLVAVLSQSIEES